MMQSQPIGGASQGPDQLPRVVVPPARAKPVPAGGRAGEADQGKYARKVTQNIPIMVRTYSQTALDPDTHEMTLKVMDASTKRVLMAWPPTSLWEAVGVHAGLPAAVDRRV